MSIQSVKLVPQRQRRTRSEARADNRRAILDSAREVIVEVGYAAAQLDQIADRAGLTKGAIYSNFGSKLDLLRALVEEHGRHFLPMLGLDVDAGSASSPEPTAEDVVAHLARSYVRLIERSDAMTLLAFEVDLFGLALRDASTLETVRANQRAVTDRLAEALAGRPRRQGAPLSASEAALAAHLVLGALGGLGQRAVTLPGSARDSDVIAAALIRLLPATAAEADCAG